MAQSKSAAASRVFPAVPLHDPRFRYVPAARTDIRKTFARARAAMRAAQAQAAGPATLAQEVSP
jgi:hypothetical protein